MCEANAARMTCSECTSFACAFIAVCIAARLRSSAVTLSKASDTTSERLSDAGTFGVAAGEFAVGRLGAAGAVGAVGAAGGRTTLIAGG